MKRVLINGRWPLNLPDHRADRPEWPYWEATRLAAMHHFIQPGDVVYDVGAEAGDFAALFTTWGAEVVLIEPNPKAWPTIRAVYEANDLKPYGCSTAMISDVTHIDALRSMIEATWPEFAYEPLDEAHGFHHIGEQDDPTATLGDLWRPFEVPHVPEVITMDVEGGEGHVMRGASKILRQHRTAWFISIHPQFMADLYGEHPDQIHDLFKSHGYHGRFLAEDHEQHWVFTHPDSGRMFPGVHQDYYIPGDRIVL